MRTLFVVLLGLLFVFALSGCEQTQTEKNFWDGMENFGKHVAREMLKDD